MKKSLFVAILLSIFIISIKAQVILQDSFGYSDGLTTTVSGGLWVRHSGSASDSFVKNGRLEVFGSRADDINRPFTNTLTSSIAYASFIVNSTNQPALSNYFAHFMVNNTTFKCKVFAAVGVAANSWRLGVSAAANASPALKIYPLDLATNVDYLVVISYDTVNFLGTLWVDPVVSSDANIQTSDITTAGTLVGFGFRQSSPNPALQVDDLFVGNAFADVVGSVVKPPTIYYQPPAGPTTVFTGNSMTLSCVGGGAGTVTFQWQHAGTNLVDDANTVGSTSNILALVSAITNQTGAYKCVVTSTTNSVFAGSVTSVVAQVVVSAQPVPPSFITQPVSQTVYNGQSVIFSTTVSSPGNVTYQWYSNAVAIAGENASTLTLNNVTTSFSGSSYRVGVTNDVVVNGILSSNAVLTVLNPPAVSIAYLRTLVDPVTYQATNVPATLPYQVTGIVTTFTNLTTGNTASYYLQDGTGGINIFATLGSTFRPAQGDVVTFVGVVSSFTSGLELYADTVNRTYTSYTILSNNIAGLPTPIIISFDILTNLNNVNYNLGGSLVMITNVYFGANAGTVLSTTANNTIIVTNAVGKTFSLFFAFLDQDTAGQTLPDYAKSVTGVLYGTSTNIIVVTKFSDIVTNVVAPAPIPLTAVLSGQSFALSWSDPTFSLQFSTNVAGPYTTIPGATSSYTDQTTNAAGFYRLYHP